MSKLGDYLIKKGMLGPEQLQEAETVANSRKLRIQDALAQLGYVGAEQIAKSLADIHGYQYYDLNNAPIPPAVVELVPESVARENKVIPFSVEDDKLMVLVADPDDFATFEKLRFILNRQIEIGLATEADINEAINRNYGQVDGESADSMLQEFTDTAIDFTETEDDDGGGGGDDGDVVDETSAPIVRLVQLMIGEAVQLRASDIHVEPFEDRVRIRYRIDGVLVERDSPPRRLLGALLSRIKILAKMDISERRRCQDGRIKITAGGKELDLRVSMLPTNHGQSCVMRLLDKDNIKIGVRQLGLSERDFRIFRNIIRRPNGILLVTGPTGSGKTTTLYAAMNELNRPDRKIITAEDPVEYYLPGINQVEVKHGIGLDFAKIIKAMLRQAPNVILVGEMRDHETASMGIQASLTGHLVFSTLHTNDAPGAITRMVDIGVPAYLVAGSVVGVLAQRLVRVNCSKCKQPYQPSASQIESAGITKEQAANATFMMGKGCDHCGKSGYRGRLGIFELMTMTSKVRELSFAGAATTEIRKAAVSEGMTTLYEDGLRKVCEGITTIEEVLRVSKKTE
ncbi:MAG: ATPase, T2SS/T4P/T4SS family [Planctomycetota bacterium]